MTQRRYDFRRFLRAESGAVTVDYVVLAAAVTGMALATSGVLTEGMSVLAANIDNELSGEPVDAAPGLTYADGFDNGSMGWGDASATEIRGLSYVLGPIAGSQGVESVTRNFKIDPDAKVATFDFDILALDSLDNESGIVFIDGHEVGRVTSQHGLTTFTAASNLAVGISITGNIVDNSVDLGGMSTNADWRDSRTNIKISVASPKQIIKFGFGSTANQPVSDESFALDNFKATGLQDPSKPTPTAAGK